MIGETYAMSIRAVTSKEIVTIFENFVFLFILIPYCLTAILVYINYHYKEYRTKHEESKSIDKLKVARANVKTGFAASY
jgi:predicted membrane protein